MARGDLLAAQIRARLALSDQTITLIFPAVRVAPTVVGPGSLPTSPMTGAPKPITMAPPSGDPERPPMTLTCLWLDAPLSERPTGDMVRDRQVGWVDGAIALARVLWEDALVDLDEPHRGTWLDLAERVEHAGLSFRVLKVEKMGPSFRAPHSVSIWLAGSNKA